MCVVNHGCCGLDMGRVDVVVGRHVGKVSGLIACREMPEHFPSAR